MGDSNSRTENTIIWDPVWHAIEFQPCEMEVINTPEFQRLHWKMQLPFLQATFRGATHTRFTHAIGTLHVAHTICMNAMSRLERDIFKEEEDKWGNDLRHLRLAALLQDINKPPFWDIFVETPLFHEIKVDLDRVLKEAIHRILNTARLSQDYSEKKILAIIDSKKFDKENKEEAFHLSQILNSEINAGAIDYLTRDSYYCGVEYGIIDTKILKGFSFIDMHSNSNARKWELAIERKYLENIIDFFEREKNMDNIIYNHKTRRAGILYAYDLLNNKIKNDQEFLKTIIDPSKRTLSEKKPKKYDGLPMTDRQFLDKIIDLEDYFLERHFYKEIFTIAKTELKHGHTGKQLMEAFLEKSYPFWEDICREISIVGYPDAMGKFECNIRPDCFMVCEGTGREERTNKRKEYGLRLKKRDGTTLHLHDMDWLADWYNYHSSRLWKIIFFYNGNNSNEEYSYKEKFRDYFGCFLEGGSQALDSKRKKIEKLQPMYDLLIDADKDKLSKIKAEFQRKVVIGLIKTDCRYQITLLACLSKPVDTWFTIEQIESCRDPHSTNTQDHLNRLYKNGLLKMRESGNRRTKKEYLIEEGTARVIRFYLTEDVVRSYDCRKEEIIQ